MADEVDDRWILVLPQVFDLLLSKPDKIIDDTSIEKLLAWMSDVHSSASSRLETLLQLVIDFLSNENLILQSCTTVSFALRLCGILWSKDMSIFKQNSMWIDLFSKSRNSEMLWREAVVRDAYFSGLSSLTELHTGLQWLQENKGCLATAVSCMSTDTSMFVGSTARLFIAKFLISSCSSNINQLGSGRLLLENIDWLMDILHQKLHLDSSSLNLSVICKDRIAVLDIIRILMDINVSVGQELISASRLLVYCVNVADAAEEDVCRKLVEVIGEIILNYSKAGSVVAWDRLLCCHTSANGKSSAQILLKISLDLYQRGMIGVSLNLISVLAFSRDETPGDFPSTWLDVLSCLLAAPLSILEDTSTFIPDCNHSDGLDAECLDTNILAADLISLTVTNTKEFEIMKNKIIKVIKPWLSNRNLQTVMLIQTLSSITEIVNKAASIPPLVVTQWIEFALKVLKGSLYTERQSFCIDIQGNDKVTKTIVTVLAALLKHLLLFSSSKYCVNKYHNLSDETINYFFQVFQVFIFLARSSQTNATIITCTLELLGGLLEHGTVILNELYQDTTTNNESAASDPKRPRLTESKDYENIMETLGFVVRLRLRDQRWEVKDSVLEFVTRLVKTRTAFGISLVEHHTLSSVWDALDDVNESYVRSSAWQALAHIVVDHHLWVALKDLQHLTEKDVITKMAHTLEHDSEAFPRRSVIDCILLWIRNRNPIVSTVLPKTLEPESTAESSSNSTEMATLFSCIVKRAFEDFDWEVKVRVLQLVETIIDTFFGGASNSSGSETRQGNLDSILDLSSHATTMQLSTVLNDVGALTPLLKACDDCDYPVCEKALSVIGSLKNYMYPHREIKVMKSNSDSLDCVEGADNMRAKQDAKDHPIATVEQLLQAMEPEAELSTEMFISIIHRVDVECLVSLCAAADTNVRSNPVCLLEDILAGVNEGTENLLDCY
ncbi:hypothetical protein QZH41_011294 [Actinostola sp. cb2023]|nr:hypothetical protein QZH41_011294 [Actinostola sp. cb2023]